MSNILVGIGTFGNLQFTRMAIESIKATSSYPLDFFIVIGKPDDLETRDYCVENNIPFTMHDQNMGFPCSVNDIYDFAWKKTNKIIYDYLILTGNDIVAYPYAIDSLIEVANTTDYDVISGSQYDIRSLITEHPETRQWFYGDALLFNDFTKRPWELFTGYSKELQIADMALSDIQNFCLYKKEVFDKIGYTDVNFYPAYYIDNDYARRIVNSKIRCCTLGNARFFHFWSRTIYQETGGSNPHFFEHNRQYYVKKWGGDFGSEIYQAPTLIDSREGELEKVLYWKNL